MNRQQQEVVPYLQEENRILREKRGGKRIILNDAPKRRLARAAKKLGEQLSREIGTLPPLPGGFVADGQSVTIGFAG
jgi:hypothetical protein